MPIDNKLKSQKLTCAFFGTPEFSAKILKALTEIDEIEVKVVVTQPDKPAGRGNKLKSSEVKIVAESLNIPVLQPKSIKKELPVFLEQLKNFGELDFAVIAVFAQILPVGLLEFFKGKCVNVHPSLLPRWRGASPIHSAMIAGDQETGVCLMKMEQGLDSGPYWVVSKTPILEDDTHDILQQRLLDLSIKLIKENLVKIVKDEVPEIKQSEIGLTYAEKLTGQLSLINWNNDAKTISNLTKGLWPSPGAFSFINGKRIKIGLTKVYQDSGENDFSGIQGLKDKEIPNGSILYKTKDTFVVKCGNDTALAVYQVQPEGKKPQTVRDYLNGNKLEIGLVYGAPSSCSAV